MDILNDSVHHTDALYENAEIDYDARIVALQENLRDNAVLMFGDWITDLPTDDQALARLNDEVIKILWDNYDLKLRLITALVDSQWSREKI